MTNFYVTRSKKTFPSHKKIIICMKKHPINPYDSTIFAKIIEMKSYPYYYLYIHKRDGYLTLRCLSLKNSEDIKIPLDYKLWIELFFVFNFVKKIKKNKDL